jgi:hypothetical protein
VVIVGVALVVYARATAPSPVGPFLQDASNPTKKDTHWHAALGVYNCDHWMGDNSAKPGTWNWPNATPTGSPARASNTNVYAGLHSHDDGVIHMEPAVSEEAGKNATVGKYFDFGGWKLSSSGFSFLGTTVKNGDKCGTATGTLQWEVGTWDGDTTGKVKQTYKVMTGNPASYKLKQYDIVVIAFLPPGKTLASIGSPPSVPNLATALGAENTPAGSVTTMPPTGSSTPTAPTTTPSGSTTPTTKPKTGSSTPTPATSTTSPQP